MLEREHKNTNQEFNRDSSLPSGWVSALPARFGGAPLDCFASMVRDQEVELFEESGRRGRSKNPGRTAISFHRQNAWDKSWSTINF
jgi:hypothetical protein